MSKPTCLLICLLLCLHGITTAQLADSLKIKLFREAASLQDRRAAIRKLFINGKFFRPQFGVPGPEVPAKNTPVKMARPIPSIHSIDGVNTTCFDTSLRLGYYKHGKWFSNDIISKTKSGDILLTGFEYDTTTYFVDAHLTKCTQQGDTIWSRLIKGGFPGYPIQIYKAFELEDNSLILSGEVNVPMPYNGREDGMLIRVSSTGELIWQKTFKSVFLNEDTASGGMQILDCKQDIDGSLYMCGFIRSNGFSRATLTFKMDLSGNVLWSKSLSTSIIPVLSGVDIGAEKLTVYGSGSYGSSISPIAIEMNKTTGDTLRTVGFRSMVEDIWKNFYCTGMVKLASGNIALFGKGFSDNYSPPSQLHTNAGFIELNPKLDFVRSGLLQSVYSNYGYTTEISVFPDGGGAFSRLGWNGSYQDAVVGTFENGQFVKQRLMSYPDQQLWWTSNFLQMDDGGQVFTNFLIDNTTHDFYTELVRLHNSDTTSLCLGKSTYLVQLVPQFYYPFSLALFIDTIVANTLVEIQHPFYGVFPNSFNILSNCKQISFCDSLHLFVPKDTVCTGTPINITIHKNKECGANPSWDYNTTAVASFLQLNDTTVTAIINQPWQGRLLATINGCRLLQDSVRLTILQSPGVLNLGADTVICPGNTVLLNAKKGYATYQWQNGSTDSVFLVTAPGKYFVTVTDACTGSFSDTVTVTAHPPIPFFIGADTAVCKKETISITAPAGFIQYRWTGININNDTLSSITALPPASSWYKVTAEKIPGCFATDSLFVTIKQTPTINLGRDTSFCAGQQLLLDAGPGFSSYQWSSGQQTQQIIVSLQGSYSVKAALNGCFGYDTLQVLSVYPLPVFTLGSDTSLCQGRQLPLTVNLLQATYQWSNGSTANTFTVTQPGPYWLKVSQQGCSKSDTIQVAYMPIPLVQLGKDTSLCQGQTLLLDAANSGATYTWQDGSAAATYAVKSQGVYSVTATLGHCMAADTIAVSYTAVPLFTLGRDTFLCTGQHQLLQPVLNTPASLLWQDGSTGPSFTVITAGTYSLLASNQCGSYTDEINILEGLCNIEMPSAFTPNGDGINDVFKVKYPFPVQQFSMIIYNRYGEKIFETSNISEGWDGKWKGMSQPLNSYVWVISFKGVNNRQQSLKGTVTIVQ